MGKVFKWKSTECFDYALNLNDKILPVAQCFIEYDEAYKSMWWEIGLDINEKAILKMSDERNYGYWLDKNMQLEDFMK